MTEDIVVEVFENERRHPVHGFGPGHLFVHPHFSDASGKIDMKYGDSLQAASPPEGLRWITDWAIERTYTQTDANGWSYAISYKYLISNAANKKSVIKPNFSQNSRRRKWTRRARLIGADPLNRADFSTIEDEKKSVPILLQKTPQLTFSNKDKVSNLKHRKKELMSPHHLEIVETRIKTTRMKNSLRRALMTSPSAFMNTNSIGSLIEDYLLDLDEMDLMSSCRLSDVSEFSTNQKIVRSANQMMSSCNVAVNTASMIATIGTPYTDLGLRFIFDPSSQLPLGNLVMTNKYMLWSWAKWLRIAFEVWNGLIDVEDIPEWASTAEYKITSGISLCMAMGTEVYEGCFSLNLLTPFQLRCQEMRTGILLLELPLQEVHFINIPVDSVVASRQILRIEINSFDGKKVSHEQPSIQKRRHSREDINEVDSVDSNNHHMSLSRTSSSDTQVSSGGVHVNTGPDWFPNRILAKLGKSNIIFDPTSEKPNRFIYLDLGWSDVDGATPPASSVVTRGTVTPVATAASVAIAPSTGSGAVGTGIRTSEGITSLNMLLMHGAPGKETYSAGQAVAVPSLVKQHQTLIDTPSHSVDLQVPLDSTIGFLVTLQRASGLMFDDRLRLPACNLYVVCQYVKWNGDDKGHQNTSLRSPSVRASTDPNFGDFDFLLQVANGYECAQYVRLELFLAGATGGTDQSMGAAFVPLSDFGVLSTTVRTYPLANFRDSLTPFGFLPGVGILKLQLNQTVTKLQPAALPTSPTSSTFSAPVDTVATVNIAHSIITADEYNSCYPADAVAAGSYESNPFVEPCTIAAPHHALEVRLPDGGGSASYVSSVSSRGSMWSMRTSTKINFSPSPLTLGQMVVEVFENERRHPISGFGPGNLFLHPHFSDASGKVDFHYESLASAAPPAGYRWSTEWQVDRYHTQTDVHGWSYAVSYDYLISNCKKNISSSTATMMRQSRRRKWFRYAIRSDSVDGTAAGGMNPAKLTLSHAAASAEQHASVVTASASASAAKLSSGKESAAILPTCVERPDNDGDDKTIVIPWHQVKSVDAVTGGVLIVRVIVHRFSGVTVKGDEKYASCELDLFVYNCAAQALKTLIEDRKLFAELRDEVSEVLSGDQASVRSLSGASSSPPKKPFTSRADSASAECEDDDDDLGDEHIVSRIDEMKCALESQLVGVADQYEQTGRGDLYSRLAVLEARICRLELYSLALANRDNDEEPTVEIENKIRGTIVSSRDVDDEYEGVNCKQSTSVLTISRSSETIEPGQLRPALENCTADHAIDLKRASSSEMTEVKSTPSGGTELKPTPSGGTEVKPTPSGGTEVKPTPSGGTEGTTGTGGKIHFDAYGLTGIVGIVTCLLILSLLNQIVKYYYGDCDAKFQ